MGDPKREELQVKEKRAILVGVIKPSRRDEYEDPLAELAGLAATANVIECGRMIQHRDMPDVATCMGPGKAEELKLMCEELDAEIVLFDNNLTPAQGRNLEQVLDTVIVDRSELILDIFASNAKTHEAKLQVELAQLLYFRPRLKRLWTHLERIEGGVGAGRGPGEKQLETDKRLLDKRISELKRKLKEVEKRRTLTVSTRKDQTTVSLVGYTNAGKSTLMRAVTGADVYVADELFATLDTRTRRWNLPGWGDVLLSDTVGFVRDLPHHLVASFRSTLQEARMADLLLHVVDVSNPEARKQIETVEDVLKQIGIDCENMLLVLNKADKCEDRSLVDVLRSKYENAVVVSAHTGEGIERLSEKISVLLGGGYLDILIETGVGSGRVFGYLAEHAKVTNREYDDENQVKISCRIPARYVKGVEKFKDEPVEVTVLKREELPARPVVLEGTDEVVEGKVQKGDVEETENISLS